MTKRLMLDTNIYDRIVARDGFTARLVRAVRRQQVEILRTPVQDEEIRRIPDAARRAAMQKVPFRRIPTNEAAWSATTPMPSEDDLIAATAEAAADVLVTEDRDLSERVTAKGTKLEVWSFDRLVRFIDYLPE